MNGVIAERDSTRIFVPSVLRIFFTLGMPNGEVSMRPGAVQGGSVRANKGETNPDQL